MVGDNFLQLSRVVGSKATQVCENSPEGSRGRINPPGGHALDSGLYQNTLSRVVGGV